MSHQPYQQQPAWGTPPAPQPPKRNGRKIAAIGCGGTLAVLVIAGIIGIATSGSNADDSSKASSSPSELTPKQRASIEADAGIPPSPDPATRSAYIADLTAINPDIVHGKPETVIDRGRNQCSSIKNGEKSSRLLETTNYRFSSPNHPNGFGTVTAAKILTVVHKRLCPDY